MKPRPKFCIPAGYRFELDGKRWRTAKNDAWDIAMGKAMCGRLLGHRGVDGAGVTVIAVKGRGIFAVQSRYARKVSR